MSDKRKYQITRRNALKAILASTSVAIGFKAIALPTKILESVKTELPKVKGCIGVNIFQSSIMTNKFTLVETWEAKELHQANLDNLSNNGTWNIIASHLAKDPSSDYFTQL